MQNGLLQSLGKQNQMGMNESLLFNDLIEGGVDPSINESIRESIQYSFVSSEVSESLAFDDDGKTRTKKDTTKDEFVMNRMNWITYLKVLFDQLESFN